MVSLSTFNSENNISTHSAGQSLLKVLTKTWSRDSHGLFDYEATNTKNLIVFINSKSKLVRKKNEVKHTQCDSELDLEERELCRVKSEEGKHLY